MTSDYISYSLALITCRGAWPPWVCHRPGVGGSPPRHNSAPSRHNTRCPCTSGAGPGRISPGHSGPCAPWCQDSSPRVSGPHSLTSEVGHPSCGDLCPLGVCPDPCWCFLGTAAADATLMYCDQYKAFFTNHLLLLLLLLLWLLLLLLC